MFLFFKTGIIMGGDVSQWKSTCLACARPWVGSPAPQKGITLYIMFIVYFMNILSLNSFYDVMKSIYLSGYTVFLM
jgi:hypothetical protein